MTGRCARVKLLAPEIESRLRAGEYGKVIARDLGIDKKTVYRVAEAAGISLEGNQHRRQLDYNQVALRVSEGASIPEIANELQANQGAIQAACYRMDITPRDGRLITGDCAVSWCKEVGTTCASRRWLPLCKEHKRQRHVWWAMRSRTTNPNDLNYCNYGGRGIVMCDRWLEDPIAFMEDMGPLPGPGRWEVDRINNNGNYEKDNCAWVTKKQNRNNQRTVRELQAELDQLREQLRVAAYG